MKAWLKLTMLGLAIAVSVFYAAFSENVTFQLVDEAGKPLPNRAVYIFNGDVKFKRQLGGDMDIYPYSDEARKREWFIAKVMTDTEGKFQFDTGTTLAQDMYFNGGSSKSGQRFMMASAEKSMDIAHRQSNSHLRIVGFENGGSTKVLYNDIYDLKRGTVKRLWLDGRTEEHSFTAVQLVMHPDNSPHILGQL